MENTSRRNLLKLAGGTSLAAGLVALLKSEPTPVAAAADHDHHGDDKPVSGSLANATVTFGGWQSEPSFDRFAPDPNDRTRNHHRFTPNVAKIEEGGTVNFIIGGFHNLIVYDHGTQPRHIDRTRFAPELPPFPPLIDDPRRRIYRGLDPRTIPQLQDRVETVHFPNRGLFLVICGVLPHFFDEATNSFQMFGYVRVVRSDER